MIGGTYLCYEGVEKIWEKLSGHAESDAEAAHQQGQVANEDEITGSAIGTDFILSAEIMVIWLNEVADEPFLSRAAIGRRRADDHCARVRRRRGHRQDG